MTFQRLTQCRLRHSLLAASMPQLESLAVNVRYACEDAFAGLLTKCTALQCLDLLLHTRPEPMRSIFDNICSK